jgi:multimeric flavodoxin WrbA
MKTLLIIYHSQSGNTEQLAHAVYHGACEAAETQTRLIRATQATLQDLLTCHGVVFGTPENFGYMSGALKYFLDRSYYACEDKIPGRPYGLFIRAGNDGHGAISSIQRILTGLKVREVHEPVLMKGEFDAEILGDCEVLGATMAAGLEAGIF